MSIKASSFDLLNNCWNVNVEFMVFSVSGVLHGTTDRSKEYFGLFEGIGCLSSGPEVALVSK